MARTKIEPVAAQARIALGAAQGAAALEQIAKNADPVVAPAPAKKAAKTASPKKNLMMRLDADLVDRLNDYAWSKRSSMAQVIAEFIKGLPEVKING